MTQRSQDKNIFFFFLIFVFLLSNAFAVDHTWKRIGPPGGNVYEILPDRNNPNLWYCIVNETLYRSFDNARTWKRINAEVVRSIALHPKNQTLYMITGRAEWIISKSVDNGETFTVLGKVPAFLSLKLDQNVPGLLYVWGEGTVFRSSDEGGSWQELSIHFTANSNFYGCDPNDYYVVDILPSPFRPETIYASVEFNTCPTINNNRVRASLVLESRDRGTNWQESFARKTPGYSFTFDPAFPDHAFAFNARQIEVLTSSGWSFLSRVSAPGQNCWSNGLVETIDKPERLLLQQTCYIHRQEDHLLLSENGGRTWKEKSSPLAFLKKFSSMSAPQNSLIVGTENGGMYRNTIDRKWIWSNTGIESQIVFNHVLASQNKIYGYQTDLFARSDDAGEHWHDLWPTHPSGHILSVAVSPHDGNHLILSIISTTNTISFYVSKDGGRHWEPTLTNLRGSQTRGTVVFDPVLPNVIFYNISPIYKSLEFGFRPNPIKLNGIFQIIDLVSDVNNQNTRYLTDGLRVFKSDDGGLNFNSTPTIPLEDEGDGAVYICQAGTKSETFLVDNDNMKIQITTNGGERWKYYSKVPAGRSGGNDPPGAGKLISADFQGMHFYAESHGHLFESINGALNWRRLNHEWPVEKRVKGSVYSNNVAYSNGLLVVATNFGLFKTIANHN